VRRLELYLTLHRIDGLPRGVYHYDPLGHRLSLLIDQERAIRGQVREASLSAAWTCEPDVLVSLTSRFQRLSWEYRTIAYATTLKHVGVLYQSMYLVATAMGLAPCALGGTNTDLTDAVLGLDPLRESTVGEFMLGSLP
jgi:SagB-type dehydrogenase family enzyme